MNITSISTKSSAHLSPLNNNNDIKLLETQKTQLQEQIQKIKESKIDNKTKQEKVKKLQDQIQQIDMKIQQKKTEKLNKNQNIDQHKQISKNQTSKVDSQCNIKFSGITQLIDADITYSKAKIISKVKNNLDGKSKILKKEIEADESRSLSGSKASAKREELQEIEFRKQSLGKKVGEMNKTVQKQVEEIKDEEIDNNNTNKDDKEINQENN